MGDISPAFFRTSLRAIFELLTSDERFGMPADESIEHWTDRIQDGLNFGDLMSPLIVLKLNFDRAVVCFASYLDAMGAKEFLQWQGEHFVTAVQEGRLRNYTSSKLRPRIQHLMLLFLGRNEQLMQLHRGERVMNTTCRDPRCAAPHHIVVETKEADRHRKRCNGPPCDNHDDCVEEEARLPLPAPRRPRPAPVVPNTREAKVSLVKRSARSVFKEVKRFRDETIELIESPSSDEMENEEN